MTVAVSGLKFNEVVIETLEGKKVEISNSILFADYFEDILSPCVTMTMQINSATTLFNLLPIRGGEKVSLDIDTAFGNFVLDGEYSLYVYKVSGLDAQKTNEFFTLHLVSREALTNETSRCRRKYQGTLKDTVEKILKEDLETKKFKTENIEETANSYSFIATQKKPFHILTWLGPKAIPISSSKTSAKSDGGLVNAKGVAGFLFFENKDGFNFRSIDSLVSSTLSQVGSSDKENIQKYVYNQVIEQNAIGTERAILNYNIEKSIDLMKSLRIGMYSNKTYFYDIYTNTLTDYVYTLKDEINNKLGNKDLTVPKEFESSISRYMVRVSDKGVLSKEAVAEDSGRDNADMAKSFSRYNLLFTQSLNMVVPCNITLKVGDVVYAEFPQIDRTNNKGIDEEISGNYLIKELRHHFEGGRMVTSLNLIRDSYGLYGPNNA
jgi:hypothetical protein